jgi:uncharacterized protein (DUF1499 family)
LLLEINHFISGFYFQTFTLKNSLMLAVNRRCITLSQLAATLLTMGIIMALMSTTEADTNKRLPLCPNSPNCISSQAHDTDHYIAPFTIIADANKAWSALANALANTRRTVVIRQTDEALHAEATSLIFRFVDDIDALLDEAAGVIHIRSASRIGYSDFGVNRKRIKKLQTQLQNQQVIK